MDVAAFLEAGTEAAELVQQRDGLLRHVPALPQAAAVRVTLARDHRYDPAVAQRLPAPAVVAVPAVGQQRPPGGVPADRACP